MMGRMTAYDQNGRMVSDFDKSDYDFLCRYGMMPEEVLEENAKLRELCHDLRKEYAYLRARPRRFYVQHEARMAAIDTRMRELGIEVKA